MVSGISQDVIFLVSSVKPTMTTQYYLPLLRDPNSIEPPPAFFPSPGSRHCARGSLPLWEYRSKKSQDAWAHRVRLMLLGSKLPSTGMRVSRLMLAPSLLLWFLSVVNRQKPESPPRHRRALCNTSQWAPNTFQRWTSQEPLLSWETLPVPISQYAFFHITRPFSNTVMSCRHYFLSR